MHNLIDLTGEIVRAVMQFGVGFLIGVLIYDFAAADRTRKKNQ